MTYQTRHLPAYTALVAFVLYICTMGSGLTLGSLTIASYLAGWDETPLSGQPVLWLLTLPLHLFPGAWVVLAVKLFAALLAALILGLVARTLQLLPWDHPWETAGRFACTLPILVAAVVCGLEFNFWQAATADCSELLDLLLLAAAVWLLLEYNVRQNARWLNAAALVWGLGLAENWVLLLLLPLFIAAQIWLLRLDFIRRASLLRLAGMGLAGLILYAVLPTFNGLAPHSPWTLKEAWHVSLHQSSYLIHMLYYQFGRLNRLMTLVVVIYFLVPTLPLLVRMRDEGTQNKSGVDRFQTWIYRCLRVGLLLACFWLAFDPSVGPRQIVQQQMHFRLSLLTFDYVTALGAGFLAGNLLLVSLVETRDAYRRSRRNFPWRGLAQPLVTAGLAVVTIGLVARNAPAIAHVNFHPLDQFGELAVSSLPVGHGVVLGDYPEKLDVFQAALARLHGTKDWLAVDTRALPSVTYRAQLEKHHPAGWLTDANRHELAPLETIQLLEQVAVSNRLFYLHPSFGNFFERFYAVPAGTIYELKLRQKNPPEAPPLTDAEMEAKEQFWTGLWDKELTTFTAPAHRPAWWEGKLAHYGLKPVLRDQDRVLGGWFSIALDDWAVRLQRQGNWRAAKTHFEEALQLNPDNSSARMGLICNTNLQATNRMSLGNVKQLLDELGNPDRVDLILRSGGPCDDPTVQYVLGSVFLTHGLLVQAAEQLERVHALVPGVMPPELALAEIYNRLQLPDRSQALISHLREESRGAPSNSALDLNLALLESYAWLLKTNVADAREVLQTVVKQHPDDPQIANRVLAADLALNDFSNSLQMVEARLTKTPEDVPSLNAKAVILMDSGHAAEAIPILDRIIALTNLPVARVNRAFARLKNQDYAVAGSELHELEKDHPDAGAVNYGLAIVAEHDHDTNAARRYLEVCLTNTPPDTMLWHQASARLEMLEPAGKAR